VQVFSEMTIHGDLKSLIATGETIRGSLTDGWEQDREAEEHMNSLGSMNREVFCFKCSKKGNRPAATLFLIQKDETTFYVVNIIPEAQHSLSFEEYNGILREFYDKFVIPACKANNTQVEITNGQADLERWLSSDTASKLRNFNKVANKRSGSAHPVDREYWYDFLASAHEEKADFSSSTLARWLHEVGGWDEEQANNLAIEYEFATGLLNYVDRERVGA
jgi:hypothetical protein